MELYSDIDGKNCLVTKISRKGWGVWYIKGWYTVPESYYNIKIPATNTNLIAGEDTDWEYVLRVIDYNSRKWCFSGGNHGNETLKNVLFITYPKGERIDLKPGVVKEINKLEVEEATSLDVKEFDLYNYANIERNYIFESGTIKLSTKFTFTKDIILGTSYMAMFPIQKDYGQNCKFEDCNIIVRSPKYGYTRTENGYENYIGKVDTLSTLLWREKNPDYKFRVWIKNRQMVDNYSNELKVFLWDINKFENKLYYSKHDTTKAKRIDAGTVWNNLQGWEFVNDK